MMPLENESTSIWKTLGCYWPSLTKVLDNLASMLTYFNQLKWFYEIKTVPTLSYFVFLSRLFLFPYHIKQEW